MEDSKARTKYQGYIDRIKDLEAELEQVEQELQNERKSLKWSMIECNNLKAQLAAWQELFEGYISASPLDDEFEGEPHTPGIIKRWIDNLIEQAAKPKMGREEIIEIIANMQIKENDLRLRATDIADAILSALSAGREGEE